MAVTLGTDTSDGTYRPGSVPGYWTLLKNQPAGVYKIDGRTIYWNGKKTLSKADYNKWLAKQNTPNPGGTSGGGGGGGGGGGLSTADKQRAFINFYKDLGLKPNMALVAKAANEKITLNTFELWVREKDTKRYISSWRGQEELSKWRRGLHVWFPNIDTKGTKVPTGVAKKWFVTYVKKGYASFDDFVVKTKLYDKVYRRRGFEQSAYAVRKSPGTFRSYMETYAQLKRAYLGEEPSNADYRTFFSHKITPDQFKQNVEALSMGAEAYDWAGERRMTKEQTTSVMYSGKKSEEYKARLARAYNLRKGLMESKPAEFQVNKTEAGDLKMEGVFGDG